MAKCPSYEEMSKKVAEKALDEFLYNGKSIREWMQIIASEDAISRDAVLDLVADYDLSMGQVIKGIHALPPVAPPEEKIGHWIKIDEGFSLYECSECEKIEFEDSNFCPNCGAKMVKPKERSVENEPKTES